MKPKFRTSREARGLDPDDAPKTHEHGWTTDREWQHPPLRTNRSRQRTATAERNRSSIQWPRGWVDHADVPSTGGRICTPESGVSLDWTHFCSARVASRIDGGLSAQRPCPAIGLNGWAKGWSVGSRISALLRTELLRIHLLHRARPATSAGRDGSADSTAGNILYIKSSIV